MQEKSKHRSPTQSEGFGHWQPAGLATGTKVFSGCFPGGWHQETESSGRACGFFRAEVNAVLELDHETEADSAYKQPIVQVGYEQLSDHRPSDLQTARTAGAVLADRSSNSQK